MRLPTLALCLTLLTSVAHAEKLKPAIEPGLWQSTHTTIINGQDVNQAIHEMREELVARQPPEEQQMMREMFAEDDPRLSRECIGESDVAAFLQREGFADNILSEKYRQNCRVIREHFNGGTHRLDVSCKAGPTIGLIGEGYFEKRIINPKHVVFTQHFDGLNMIHENKYGEPESIDSPSDSRNTDEMVWLGTDCGGLAAGTH